jgi:osmotically-inducible protein OsmY
VSRREGSAYREERIRQALSTDPRVLEPELDVTVRGSHVIVTGTVATEARRRHVRDIVREHLPDADIDDRLDVAELTPPGSP